MPFITPYQSWESKSILSLTRAWILHSLSILSDITISCSYDVENLNFFTWYLAYCYVWLWSHLLLSYYFILSSSLGVALILNFISGQHIQPKRDLSRFVRWPKYIKIQRQKSVLQRRLKIPPPINQFSHTVDRATGILVLLTWSIFRSQWWFWVFAIWRKYCWNAPYHQDFTEGYFLIIHLMFIRSFVSFTNVMIILSDHVVQNSRKIQTGNFSSQEEEITSASWEKSWKENR